MYSCENLDAIREPLHCAADEQRSCLEFSEEPISKQDLCSEADGKLIDPKENSTIEPNGCCSDSRDSNANCVSSADIFETFMNDRDDGIKRDNRCGIDLGQRNSMDKEPGVYLNGACSALDVCKMETDASCSKPLELVDQDRMFSSLEASQIPSVEKSMMEPPRMDLKEAEQMEDENDPTSSTEGCVEGSSDGLGVIDNDNRDQPLLLKQHELPRQSIAESILPANCIEQDEQKDVKNINGPLVLGVSGHINGKYDLLTKKDEDSHGATLPSSGSETGSELASVTNMSGKFIKQDAALEIKEEGSDVVIGNEGISITYTEGTKVDTNDFSTDKEADKEANACYDTSIVQTGQLLPESIAGACSLTNCITQNHLKDPNFLAGNGMEGDMCNQTSPSQCGEVPPKVLDVHELVSSSHKEIEEKDDKVVGDLSPKSLKDIADTKIIHAAFNEMVPLKASQMDLEELNEAYLQSDFSERNDQIPEKKVGGPSSENVTVVLEENGDVTICMRAEDCRQVSPVEETAFGSEVDSPISGSSFRLDVTDLSEKSAVGVLSSSNTIDCSELTNNEGRNKAEIACVSGTNCSETILSYSRRRGQKGKLSQKPQTRRIAVNSRKSTRMQQSQGNFELVFKCARRKRSCFSKPARSSGWGFSRGIAQMFWKSNDLTSEVPNQALQKSQGGLGNGKQTKNGGCLRLKVKFGKSGGLNPLSVTAPKAVDHSLPVNNYGTGLHQEADLEIPKSANCVEDKLVYEEIKGQSEVDNNSNKNMSDWEPDDSLMDRKLKNKGLECGEFYGKSAGDATNYGLKLSSNVVVEESVGAEENRFTDAGTLPDSEVINLVPDALVSAGHQGYLHHTVMNTSEAIAAPGGVIDEKKGKKKGKKKDNDPAAGSFVSEDLSLIGSPNKSKPPKSQRGRQKRDSSSRSTKAFSSPIQEKASSNACCSVEHSSEHRPLLRENEFRVSRETLEMESCNNAKTSPIVESQFAESKSFRKMLASTKSHLHGIPKNSTCSRTNKGKSKFSESAKGRRRNASGKREDKQKTDNKSIGKDNAGDQDADRVEIHREIGCHIADGILKTDIIDDVPSPNVANGDMVLGVAIEERASTESAWVRCDDCFKWRCIPAALVESIGNFRWVCMDNLDKDFADCSIPQEMTNDEINAELGITEAEADAYDSDVNYHKNVVKGLERKRVPANRKACFKAIKTNQFLHRNRKAQTIDEIMVCHCKPPFDGRLGCRDECLNRMLNIECVQGTCPCGDLCSNQQFQKRQYTKFERFHSGKKGNGLKLLEEVCEGQFLIEYVGEVLDMQAYEARQKEYAVKGQKHFYFMTLNGNEVIDAGAKGNLGRFINHSCEPNCRTEKWMVNGEISVGIFALRDMRKDEEVTFDYNYVRVFGAAAKKCYCGSLHCRGYIGGDPLNGDVVVQSDSDDEFPEPGMLEDDETSAEVQMAQNLAKDGEKIDVLRTTVQTSIPTEIEDSKSNAASTVSQTQNSVSIEDSERKFLPPLQPLEVSTEDVTSRSIAVFQQDVPMQGEYESRSFSSVNTLETSPSLVVNKLSSDGGDADKMSKYASDEDKNILPRPRPLMKTSRSSGSVKKEKGSSNPLGGTKMQPLMVNKLHQQPNKSKGLGEVSSRGHIETVEGKLNELLDSEGGISKRKDSTKGYLKLLLLTAASRGNASSEGIQSNRDLSMILDALLKTKSRAVLMDIINKNGLQMLHNIMKQYRWDFKKIPILRKLLKVLEYLAAREILSLEHIIRGPPCLGMESFRESMLTLTEHDDKQVHQIARNFRDRWIPKPFRKPRYIDRDETRMQFQRDSNHIGFSASLTHQQYLKPTESAMPSKVATTSETVSVSEGSSDPNSSVSQTNGPTVRKRKSRWDQPAMKEEQKTDTTLPQQIDNVNGDNNIRNQIVPEDVPPGFSSSIKPLIHPKTIPDTVVAQPQPKFLSRISVSYGIPLTVLQEFGTPHTEAPDSWAVAPGIPFHPFPPLPPLPRKNYNNGSASPSVNSTTASGHGHATCPRESGQNTTVGSQVCWNIPVAENTSAHKRMRGSSFDDIGRRYFRQQKCNVPPWIRNGWGSRGNNFKGGIGSVESGNVTNEKLSNFYSPQDTGCGRVETYGSNSYQQQNQ